MAETEPMSSSLILNGGYSSEKNACASPWLSGLNPGGSCSEGNTALRLAYDYQITRTWGFEISYGDLGNSTGSGTWASNGLPATWSMKAIGWSYAGTATVPLGDGLSLFGKLGTVRAEFSESLQAGTLATSWNGVPISRQIKNALTYGFGLQYELSKKYALRTQYENFGTYDIYGAYGTSSSRIGISMVSAGMVLKF